MENKRILITGGGGFIGKNLIEKLDKNNDLIILDKEQVNFENSITADIRKKDWFDKVGKVDYIFHLASIVGVDYVAKHPIEIKSTEIQGMKNIIEFAKKKDIKKIFYSSTSSIYETANRPTPYNMSKLFAEQLLTDSKLNFTIMRYFNAYGKYQQEKMVISRFINLALNDKPLTIFSNGKQTRDFTFIEDAINATIIISDSDKTDYKTLDIGTGKETNILELVSTIKEITDSNSKIIHKDPPEERIPFEVKRRACNPKMLKELLGFECKTTISEGIRKTVEHIKNKE